jgi:DNA-binding XRE family transcriptional regulator
LTLDSGPSALLGFLHPESGRIRELPTLACSRWLSGLRAAGSQEASKFANLLVYPLLLCLESFDRCRDDFVRKSLCRHVGFTYCPRYLIRGLETNRGRLKHRDHPERLRIGRTVRESSIFSWEANEGAPDVRFMPAIIRFLGHNPLPEAMTPAEQLVRQRTTLGLSREDAAVEIGVDAGTLARWERGEREPAVQFLGRVERFRDDGETRCADVRRVG